MQTKTKTLMQRVADLLAFCDATNKLSEHADDIRSDATKHIERPACLLYRLGNDEGVMGLSQIEALHTQERHILGEVAAAVRYKERKDAFTKYGQLCRAAVGKTQGGALAEEADARHIASNKEWGAIVATPAASLEDIIAKVRALAWCQTWEPAKGDETTDELLQGSILADLEALGAPVRRVAS